MDSTPAYIAPATKTTLECDLLVLGAGPGGYTAAFHAADLGLSTVLVERYPTLGGVCLNVGCIPSKALLHATGLIDQAAAMAAHGIVFGPPQIDLDQLRAYKDRAVSKLTHGLAHLADLRGVQVVQGNGTFTGPHTLAVAQAQCVQPVHFKQAIIAAGSQAARLPMLPDDPRIVDATGALALPMIPERMLVIGGGIIGLEMATVYSALGATIDLVEMTNDLMTGADRDLAALWEQSNRRRFGRILRNTRTTGAVARPDGIYVSFEGAAAPAELQRYEMVLVAVGRQPNGHTIGAEHAGVLVDARGFIAVDQQQRTNIPHIFAVGDITGAPMLAHKAVHEAHVAAQAAAGRKAAFDARQVPAVAYTDPEVAWTGKTEAECQANQIEYNKTVFPWAASGRAIASGQETGLTKLLFDKKTRHVIGGGIVGAHAGELIGEICLAIEMGADAADLSLTIHPHPTLNESISMAAEILEGFCTDLPPGGSARTGSPEAEISGRHSGATG